MRTIPLLSTGFISVYPGYSVHLPEIDAGPVTKQKSTSHIYYLPFYLTESCCCCYHLKTTFKRFICTVHTNMNSRYNSIGGPTIVGQFGDVRKCEMCFPFLLPSLLRKPSCFLFKTHREESLGGRWPHLTSCYCALSLHKFPAIPTPPDSLSSPDCSNLRVGMVSTHDGMCGNNCLLCSPVC